MFEGSIPALVTPMQPDGSIAYAALKTLIEWHIQEGSAALVIAGTTGESATLSAEEQEALIRFSVQEAAGRIPIIAGTGSNSTETALKLTLNAEKAGASACLIVTPYYNKPTQEGLYQHYKFLAEHSTLPIILYNVPGRTACDLLPETVLRLSKLKQIIGLKEASGKRDRFIDLRQHCGPDFALYSGDDALALDAIQLGAKGVISVTANLAPAKMQALCQAALQGDFEKAKALNQTLLGLHQNLFLESNPIPTKWALAQLGRIPPGLRLPLTPLSPIHIPALTEAMQQAGVLLEHA